MRLPGRRGEAVGHLGLHHHEHPLQGAEPLEEREQHGDGDVVRQVGDEGDGRRSGQLVHVERVRQHDRQPVAAVLVAQHHRLVVGPRVDRQPGDVPGDRGGQQPRQRRVDLDGDDVGAGLEQPERQRAQPGADLDHAVALRDVGLPDDLAHRAAVEHEVLAEGLGRAHARALGELADLRGPEQLVVVDMRTSLGEQGRRTPRPDDRAGGSEGASAEEVRPAVRPLAGAGAVVEHLRAGGLLLGRGLRGQPGAADGLPTCPPRTGRARGTCRCSTRPWGCRPTRSGPARPS